MVKDKVTHPCSKERELGIMATKIENIDQKTDRIENKLDKFIDKADSTYATKEELYVSVSAINKLNEKQEQELDSTKKKIVDLTLKVAQVSVGVAVILKLLGLY